MWQCTLRLLVCNDDAEETGKYRSLLFEREVSLPFTPFAGLRLSEGAGAVQVVREVEWSLNTGSFIVDLAELAVGTAELEQKKAELQEAGFAFTRMMSD